MGSPLPSPVAAADPAPATGDRLANRPVRRPAGHLWPGGFLTPLVAVLSATTIVPVAYTVALSLGPASGSLDIPTPAGFGNYADLITSRAVWRALWLAVVFLVGALGLEIALGVGTALLVDRFLPRQRVVRALLLWPAVLPPIAVALIFKYLLQGDIGLVSHYLALLGYDQAWLTSAGSAMAVIVGIDVWQYTPFVVLLTLAALQAVPDEVREAAALDGAGAVRVARHVVLPIIQPALISIALLRFIDAIQVFPTIYVLTRGGPGVSTQLLTYYNYQLFFGQLQFGYGAAMAILVVLFTVACVLLLVRWQRKVESL